MTAPPGTPASGAPKPGTYTLNDGSQETVRADGSRIIVRPDGRREVLAADGTLLGTSSPAKPGLSRSNKNLGQTSTGKTAVENKWDAAAAAPAQAQAAAVAKQDQADALAAWNAQNPVWVNGQRMLATHMGANGVPDTYTYVGSKAGNTPDEELVNGKATPLTSQGNLPTTSAFGALDVGANYGILAGISGADQFVMSAGPTNINTGQSIYDQGVAMTGVLPDGTKAKDPAHTLVPGQFTPAGASHDTPAGAENSESANVTSNGASKMTIAQGLDMFVNLSHSNPAAYGELVNMLKHAGYFGSSTGDMTGGPYSENAGLGYVKALKDLSVYQQTTGDPMSFADFLNSKKAALQQQAAAQTQKVFRDYTDQGSIMATARQAAQAAIGRNLTPAELQAFESNFRGQENAYYNSEDAAAVAQAQAKAIGESAPSFSGTRPDASGQVDQLLQGNQFTQDRYNYASSQVAQTLMQLFNVK
jgi:hypothetical protein